MIVPSAEIIEQASGMLADPVGVYRTSHAHIFAEQIAEVRAARPGMPETFYAGYMLGVAACRVLVSGLPVAIENKVEI
jgi:hypothetical protein